MDFSPPGSSVHGILQERRLEWVAMSFSRASSPPRDWTGVSCVAGRFFTIWATWEAPSEVSCQLPWFSGVPAPLSSCVENSPHIQSCWGSWGRARDFAARSESSLPLRSWSASVLVLPSQPLGLLLADASSPSELPEANNNLEPERPGCTLLSLEGSSFWPGFLLRL